ncbi:chorismate mutase [Serratia marcescens VGH107]|nr:chorismate mutase [Serratia marcescens VGH107]
MADEPATDVAALRGRPTVDGGKCCQTLGEVRHHIDAIDQQIIALMAERQQYVQEAARFKANPAQVEAPARVEAVLQKVSQLAVKNGLSPEVARVTYSAMINGFINYEHKVFTSSKKQSDVQQ